MGLSITHIIARKRKKLNERHFGILNLGILSIQYFIHIIKLLNFESFCISTKKNCFCLLIINKAFLKTNYKIPDTACVFNFFLFHLAKQN